MKERSDFLLSLFTGVDKFRPALAFPNMKDGVVYATDGHVLISIPEENLALKYETKDNYPNAQKTLDRYVESNKDEMKVSMSAIAKELIKARIEVDKKELNCEECNGTGELEWEYEDKKHTSHYEDFECPVCKGERTSKEEHPFARIRLQMIEDENGDFLGIDVGHFSFHPFQLYRLFMVALIHNIETVVLHYNKDEYGGVLAYFGKTTVLIMPRKNNRKK